jgi:hypothetical protein
MAVEDEQVNTLKRLLETVSYVKTIEEEGIEPKENEISAPSTRQEKIKAILAEAKGTKLFSDIEDPVEWQREIRKN